MLRSALSDYGNAYIVTKWTINLKVNGNNDMPEKDVVLKINASFRSCITKINNMLIDHAKDFDICRIC